MSRLKDKVAIVTGGARGTGATIALRFAQEGALVVGADIKGADGQATARAIADQTGARVIPLRCDVADEASVRAMVQACKDQLGAADVLVNNAGIAVFREPLAMTSAEWKRCMSVDLDGARRCTRSVLPDMLARGWGDHQHHLQPRFHHHQGHLSLSGGQTRSAGDDPRFGAGVCRPGDFSERDLTRLDRHANRAG